jgi:hypothetical protein
MRRKAEGDEVEPPKPKKKSSGPKFNDDTEVTTLMVPLP